MRMPFTQGHSRAVAELADAASRAMGLPDADVRALRWSGCIHDIGELVVPVSTWMRNGPLSVRERDAAQLHCLLRRAGARLLRPRGRADGGAGRCAITNAWTAPAIIARSSASDLSPAARILAAAEMFQTSREERPHRKALSAKRRRRSLRPAVREGCLCADAAEAVLPAAGQPSRRARPMAARRHDAARDRGPAPDRRGADGEGDGAEARHLAQDRRPPYPEHLRQDRRDHPRRRGALCGRARPAPSRIRRRHRESSRCAAAGKAAS